MAAQHRTRIRRENEPPDWVSIAMPTSIGFSLLTNGFSILPVLRIASSGTAVPSSQTRRLHGIFWQRFARRSVASFPPCPGLAGHGAAHIDLAELELCERERPQIEVAVGALLLIEPAGDRTAA
jgi:hypothetical protein